LKDIVKIVHRECFESAKIQGRGEGGREREGGRREKEKELVKDRAAEAKGHAESKNQSIE